MNESKNQNPRPNHRDSSGMAKKRIDDKEVVVVVVVVVAAVFFSAHPTPHIIILPHINKIHSCAVIIIFTCMIRGLVYRYYFHQLNALSRKSKTTAAALPSDGRAARTRILIYVRTFMMYHCNI